MISSRNFPEIHPTFMSDVSDNVMTTMERTNVFTKVQVPLLDMLSKPLQEELQLQRHLESFSDNEFLNKLLVHSDYQIYRVVCNSV